MRDEHNMPAFICTGSSCVSSEDLMLLDASQSVCDVLKKGVCARHFTLIQMNFMNHWMIAKCSKKCVWIDSRDVR